LDSVTKLYILGQTPDLAQLQSRRVSSSAAICFS
jgi:hypothetical protein